MKISTEKIQLELKKEYKMDCRFYGGNDVMFFGSELDCYRMAYRFKNLESRVSYSANLETWFVSFPMWFDLVS